MKTQVVIQEFFKNNLLNFPEDYLEELSEAKDALLNVSNQYWEHRTEHEILRDNDEDNKPEDYLLWCEEEFCSFLNENIERLDLSNIRRLEEFTGEDITGNFDFYRDLYGDGMLSYTANLNTSDQEVNFIFEVIKENKWNSILKLIEIECV